MKKFLLFLSIFLVSSSVSFAQMSDSQVMDLIQQEMSAGTSQSQIVTKLMQKGVKIDQIRRMRQHTVYLPLDAVHPGKYLPYPL